MARTFQLSAACTYLCRVDIRLVRSVPSHIESVYIARCRLSASVTVTVAGHERLAFQHPPSPPPALAKSPSVVRWPLAAGPIKEAKQVPPHQ